MSDSMDGGYDPKEVVEKLIICGNVCESMDKKGKVVKCPDLNTPKCLKSKDFNDSSLPEKGIFVLDHENFPPKLHRISVVTTPTGGGTELL